MQTVEEQVKMLEEEILKIYDEADSNYNSIRYDDFDKARRDLFDDHIEACKLSFQAVVLAHDLNKKELKWKADWLVNYIDALKCMVDLHRDFKEIKPGAYSKTRFRKMEVSLKKLKSKAHEQSAMGFKSLKEKGAPIYTKYEDQKEIMHRDTQAYFEAVNGKFEQKFSYKPVE